MICGVFRSSVVSRKYVHIEWRASGRLNQRSGPSEGFGLAVVVLDELVDSGNEFFDAPERSAPDGLLGDEAEPSLDLIEPRGVSGREVEMKARP